MKKIIDLCQNKNEDILAIVDNKLKELGSIVPEDSDIKFISIREQIGHRAYVDGLIFMMLKAFYEVIGFNKIKCLRLECLIGNGYYFKFDINKKFDKETVLKEIYEKMNEYVEKDIIIEKEVYRINNLDNDFKGVFLETKKKLFKYMRSSYISMYKLDKFHEFFSSYLPYSTGILKYFKIQSYKEGFLLLVPNRKTPNKVDDFVEKDKLFNTIMEASNWNSIMNIRTVADLNNAIVNGKIEEIILLQEALQEKNISEIAKDVYNSKKKLICIAGPTSSGKTSFSRRLEIQLKILGLKPVVIGVDNYYKNRDDVPIVNGEKDYECLEALDVETLNNDLVKLINAEEIEIPYFNFQKGIREYKGEFLKMENNSVIIIEGIHGLNDKLTYKLDRNNKYKIYISALNIINIDEHNRIPTTDARLIRRIVRDAKKRGTSAKETIKMWNNVRQGEEKYIFPFQEDVDFIFNSGLIYEFCILKGLIESELYKVEENCEEYIEAKRLLKILNYFLPIHSEVVPRNSLIREFLGGSCFDV